MTIEEEIRDRLENNFTIHSLEIKNESAKHKGHAGDNGTGQSHFRIEITADEFIGCSRVQRHRMINNTLVDLFDSDLHAISLGATATVS